MTSVTRLFTLAATTAVTVLAAGCASQGSAGSAVPPASHSAPVPASHAAASEPITTATAVASASPAQAPATPSVTSTAGSVPSGAGVYLAESQDVRGTTAHAPGCQAGCPLSGDGTTVLWDMTWPTWTGSQAVGTGTEKIDGCDPNCAAGPEYAVAVTVTFSQPARDCALGEWFWTYATFTWPDGLPSALTGAGAPANPWDFTQVKAEATQSCA
jgi:hypothetical protein